MRLGMGRVNILTKMSQHQQVVHYQEGGRSVDQSLNYVSASLSNEDIPASKSVNEII